MCGIAGIIGKGSENLGEDLVNMLRELVHRGRDATGVALYEQRDTVALRVSMTGDNPTERLLDLLRERVEVVDCSSYGDQGPFSFLEAQLILGDTELADLNWMLDSDPDFCVHSIGSSLKVYKDGGSAQDLADNHTIKVGTCSHGIGHVRMATESVENINFAHPFTSYLLPELSLVHNGQFTNYFNMRRKMEARGVRFKTNNDSEIAAHFLAWEMTRNGLSMAEAMTKALDELDGVFTIIAATDKELGIFRDRLGIKPILYYESDDGMVVLGSEQIAFTPILDDIFATELEPGGVKVWSV